MACYGPQAALFTLGPNHTVQQYDTSPPALVKTVQYHPMLPPPTPAKQGQNIPGAAPPMQVNRNLSEQDRGPVTLSTIQKTANEMGAIEHARNMREEMGSPVSSTSRTDTVSSRSSGRRAYPRHIPSISSRAQSGTTFSTVSPSMVGRDSLYSGTTSMYPSTASFASSGRRSKGSRLRNEVLRSPESTYVDLFPRTRVRLANMSYQQTQPLDQDNMTPDDLRLQMLEVVFGWNDDIEPLVRDELHHHQPGSTSAVLLSKWLGEVDSDMMAAAISSGNVSSSDWMVLALSQMGGSGSMGKMGQAFVQRLLQQGDFHTSATILLGLGDREDAVEVYVSRSFYMEAILLTCLLFPSDWERQAHLVRRWGEFVVENSQQHLAIRCFTCTGVEPPIPWSSPSPRPVNTPSQAPSSISSMLSPPISPPSASQSAPPVRMTAKNASLKVITSFEQPAQPHFRFPGLASTDRTPTNGPGVTPIAESAISPGGTPGGWDRRLPNNVLGRTITPGGYRRNRLPSIGETPADGMNPQFIRPSQLPTPDNSGSDLEKEKETMSRPHTSDEKLMRQSAEAPPLLLSSARYDPATPMSSTRSPMTAVPQTSIRTTVLPNPSEEAFIAFQEKSRARSESKDRNPEGLHIRMPSQDQIMVSHYIDNGDNDSRQSDLRRSNATNSIQSGGLISGGLSTGYSDMSRDGKSPSISGQSWASTKSPSISGRSMDQYISSLEEAGYRSRKNKTTSRRRSRERKTPTTGEHKKHRSRSKGRARDRSGDRGRDEKRYIRPAKRSPSSPKPMSPETYRDPNSGESLDGRITGITSPVSEGRHLRDYSKPTSTIRSGSKASNYSQNTVRRRSPDGFDNFLGSEASFSRSRVSSRQPSPRGLLDPNGRGRSASKDGGSIARSPSSPLPMSPQAKYYQASDEEEDPVKIVAANRQRLRSRHRSGSRKPRERGTSTRRDISTDRRRAREERHLRGAENDEPPRSALEPRRSSGDSMLRGSERPDIYRQKSERTQKKELAARELEARRESLLRNPEAPQILRPEEVNGARPNLPYRAQTDLTNNPNTWNPASQPQQRFPMNSAMDNTGFIDRAASVGPYGLPATPRAMRHPRYDNKANEIPAVPEIPETIQPLPETYYTGHPINELPRSMSAPIPEQPYQQGPDSLPRHPAFHKGLHASKRSNFPPLGEIGQHRRRPSSDAQGMMHAPVTAGIDETLHAHQARNSNPNLHYEEPPLLPELQHLQAVPPPPPPVPPPPPFAQGMDTESSSLSSNSNVGVIEMVLDNEPENEDKVIEVPPMIPPPPPIHHTRSPPIGGAGSPPPEFRRPGSSHKRGRSDNMKSGIKGFTDRLRSNSRGRNAKSPEQTVTPSPYESVPTVFF